MEYLRKVEQGFISGSVSLMKENLEAFPVDVGVMSHVTSVNLSNNFIVAVSPAAMHMCAAPLPLCIFVTIASPTEFLYQFLPPLHFCNTFLMYSCRSLDLESNKISSLPREISRLTCLTHLNVKHNKLVTLPFTLYLPHP